MELYVAVVQDRHLDPIIGVFTEKEAAIDWALATFQEHVEEPGEVVEETDLEGSDWLWHAEYGDEGDHAWVEATTLDQP